MHKRTDSTLFYLRGHYKSFTPFIFNTSVVQFIVMETAVSPDSASTISDTIIICQVTGVTTGLAGKDEAEAKKQFDYLRKKYGKEFISTAADNIIENDKIVGKIIDYYATYPLYLPVLTAYYSKLAANNNYAFSMILRIKINQNLATLPVAPDDF